jgi:erythronate-4-phosphate dehydrogenase
MKIIADANIPFVQQCFSSIGEVELLPGRKITPHSARDADVLLVRSVTKVNSQLLSAGRVRFVGTATIGFEHVDVEYLQKNNIAFASAPGSNANSVAEYVIAALLSVANNRKIELEGKSIAVIGVGNCGSRVAQKCTALGMKVFLNDPPLQRKTKDPKFLPIEALFDCDFITFHTPLTFGGLDRTFHLADENFFKLLKAGCVFINSSRGGVVDTMALKNIIRSAKLKAVVLDVWENEPNIDTELLRMVDIGTPHIAGYSLDGKVVGMIMIYKAACKHFGLEPEFDAASFLPPPAVSEIRVDLDAGKEQDVIHQTVQQVYAINRDDFNTREILMVPDVERGRFFDDLRKNYPVRREFQNTRVVLAPAQAGKRLAKKLKGIGFQVSSSSCTGKR